MNNILKIDPAQLEVDIGRPSMRALAHLLRHQELWPERFHWDYTRCETCAMGLAARLWNCTPASASVGPLLGINIVGGRMYPKQITPFDIFIAASRTQRYKENRHIYVTPELVADLIDDFLNEA